MLPPSLMLLAFARFPSKRGPPPTLLPKETPTPKARHQSLVPGTTAEAAATQVASGDLEAMVWDQLKTCFDPEIPVNIVDLGLVYGMEVGPAPDGTHKVDVKMTLTAQGCGMGATIAVDAKHKILTIPGISEANVDLVWDPPWNPQMISPEGRERLGIE